MAVQSSFIFGQHTIYGLDVGARARLNSSYIATFFLGGAIGSQAGAIAYHAGGWTALTALGAALPVLALLGWAFEPQQPAPRIGPDAPARDGGPDGVSRLRSG